MVPFPLPAIGRIPVDPKVTLDCVAMQTEYTWVSYEFPTRILDGPLFHSEPSEKPVSSRSPRKQSPVKRKQPSKPSKEDEPESQPELAIETAETQEVLALAPEPTSEAQETPKKRGRKTLKETVATPATPATTAAPDTPATSEPAATFARSKSMLDPIISDSSDDELPLLSTAIPLTRTVTPQSMKPTVGAASASPKKATTKKTPSPKKVAKPVLESSDSESGESSSSSDSDNEMPSASLISGSSKKKESKSSTEDSAPKTTNTTSPRMGPLVQVNCASESEIEAIRNEMLNLIPEPLRKGSIKEAVADAKNKRVIFQLRILPKVVNFLAAAGNKVSVDGEERALFVLSESERRKAFHLFRPAEEETLTKKHK